MMDIDEAIRHIEALYPADADEKTGEIGRALLEQAQMESNHSWRDEADPVLIRYAQLCLLYHRDGVI
ncbi:MAG: hypothetical protein DRJ03_14045 [Chloroflexi bacterium]|nr:MAG: hypothetical protein DRJ03_14045 [Chloroflexota bacterium]